MASYQKQPSLRPQYSFEQLEGRCLLSGLEMLPGLGTPPYDAESSGRRTPVAEVRILELSQSGKIHIERLPESVAAAVKAQFPGATIVSAERISRDRRAYGLGVVLGESAIEIELSSRGEVLKVEQDLAFADLPQRVRDTLSVEFPGAVIREVGSEEVNGESQFEILVEAAAATADFWSGGDLDFGAIELEVTIAADGGLVEVERLLSPGDLPEAVRDWAARRVPGGTIREAELVSNRGELSYELEVETLRGRTLEAYLKVQERSRPVPVSPLPGRFQQRDDTLVQLGATFEQLTAVSNDFTSTANLANHPEFPGQAATKSVPTEVGGADEAVSLEAAPESNPDGVVGVTVDISGDQASAQVSQSERLSRAIDFAALTGSVTFVAMVPMVSSTIRAVPQIASTLSEVFPVDLAALEHSLREILDAVESGQPTDSARHASLSTPRILMAVALTVSAERLISRLRLKTRPSELVAGNSRSSWTWIMSPTTWNQQR